MKKKKIITIFILVILLVITTAITAFYVIGQNSESKQRYEAQMKEEGETFVKEQSKELEAVDTSDAGLEQDDEVLQVETSTEVPKGVITEAEQQAVAKELAKLEDERKQQVLQTLSVAYSKALNEQKENAFASVDALIAQAKAEWSALQSKGEATTENKIRLATEYLAKSNVLEEQMDVNFAGLVNTIETQLAAEGIDSASLVAEYQAQYETIKQENKDALMTKVMAAL